MEQTPELTKALSELKRLTGLTMQITADTPEETATALEQIRCLCTAYREKYNKNDFLLSLMKNGIRLMIFTSVPDVFISRLKKSG